METRGCDSHCAGPLVYSGMTFVEVGDDADETMRIRGYMLDVKDHEVWESLEEGKVIDGNSKA